MFRRCLGEAHEKQEAGAVPVGMFVGLRGRHRRYVAGTVPERVPPWRKFFAFCIRVSQSVEDEDTDSGSGKA